MKRYKMSEICSCLRKLNKFGLILYIVNCYSFVVFIVSVIYSEFSVLLIDLIVTKLVVI